MSSSIRIDHHCSILLIGSCFSDEIGKLLRENGFEVSVNPGGTLFHPLALGKLLKWGLAEAYTPLRLFQREDVFLSWDLSGSIYAMDEQTLDQKCAALHGQLHSVLRQHTHLLITFGSSWAYALGSDGQIVANCHKAPKSRFIKALSKQEDMFSYWNNLLFEIRQVNPSLQIIFTISPVRHLKDGLIENNRSKARLHLLVEQLCEQHHCTYFEAFEIVTDQLRDYSYYKEDGAHPNHKAITEVWNLFVSRFMAPDTKNCLTEWEEVQKLRAHKLLYPESQEARSYLENLKQKQTAFFTKYPDFQRPTPF